MVVWLICLWPRWSPRPASCKSDRVVADLARADADRLFDETDEDLAVADLVGAGGGDDRGHGGIDHVVGQHDLDFHLGQEVDDIFGTAIKLGMALLAAKALDLGDAEALDARLLQGFLDLIKLERLDDGFNLLHGAVSPVSNCVERCRFNSLSTAFCGSPQGIYRVICLIKKQGLLII